MLIDSCLLGFLHLKVFAKRTMSNYVSVDYLSLRNTKCEEVSRGAMFEQLFFPTDAE